MRLPVWHGACFLIHNPENGWALYGLAKSLQMLGDKQAAARIEKAFKQAWRYADIPAPIVLFPKRKVDNPPLKVDNYYQIG